ncbi:hypothetical protein VTL71DRAFT_10127 [Oculimacula yallundae]|uniref:Uncharacterized protein n=1 Tax=Oculimacula yallundae TaxID=86028 RepID=A0ABR4BPM9_9HELO
MFIFDSDLLKSKATLKAKPLNNLRLV